MQGSAIAKEQQPEVIRVGILSDTHGRFPPAAFAALADSDYLIHAGDIGDPGIIRELKTIAPVTAVLGNNDFDEYGQAVTRFAHPVIGGVRFLVAHYPQDVNLSGIISSALKPGDTLPYVCIHGHTHIPKITVGKKAAPAHYLICPGSVSRPRGGSKPSIVKLIIVHQQIKGAYIEEL